MEGCHHRPVVDADSSPVQAPDGATGRTRRRRATLAAIFAVVVVIAGGVGFFIVRRSEPRFQGDLHTLLLPAPAGYPPTSSLLIGDSAEKGGGLTEAERRDLGFVQGASTTWVVGSGDSLADVSINLFQFGSASKAAAWVGKFGSGPTQSKASHGGLSDIPGSKIFALDPINSFGPPTVGFFTKHDIAAQVTYISRRLDLSALSAVMRQQYARLP
jgi:hypothetical protein